MSTTPPRTYRAIFFDLDGTLVPMELEEFLGGYYRALGNFVEARGYDREAFLAALNKGVVSMMKHPDGTRNDEAFWETFPTLVGSARSELEPLMLDFYEHDFGHVGDSVAPAQAAQRAVAALSAKGYPLALTTMPLFPQIAVEWRLRWAGVDPALFQRITTYENSTSTKPKLAYFAENVAAFGVRGSDVLMVGNNTVEDLVACGLGSDAFLVTNHMIDPIGLDLATVKHGTIDEFADWAEALPACANPAGTLNAGPVDPAETAAVLERDADPAALERQNAALKASMTENERRARGTEAAGVARKGAE